MTPSTVDRRRVLRGGLGLGALAAAGCAPPLAIPTAATADLYVALARERTVAVLDTVTDRVTGRISLARLGRQGFPWQLGVGPLGNVAVLPLVSSGPDVGVVTRPGLQHRAGGAVPGPAASGGPRRAAATVARVRVAGDAPSADPFGPAQAARAAQALTVDGRGNAYVLVGDSGTAEGASAAVVDLATGAVLRHLPLAGAGDAVIALAVRPDGERLYAARWRWEPSPTLWGGHPVVVGGRAAGAAAAGPPTTTGSPGPPRPPGPPGRLVAFDTRDGRVRAHLALPDDAAVIALALAAPPPGSGPAGAAGLALYAVLSSPGPARDEDDWARPDRRYALLALDEPTLDPLAAWPLDERPTALAMLPDGRRAYLLAGPVLGGAWSRRLVCLDLAGGAISHRWPLPGGCLALALGPAGKAYVADLLGDRLWRVDTRTNTLLGALSLAGAPIALAAGPS